MGPLMAIDPATEARFFGRLAVKGILQRGQVEKLFDQARKAAEAGNPVSLAGLAVSGRSSRQRSIETIVSDGRGRSARHTGPCL